MSWPHLYNGYSRLLRCEKQRIIQGNQWGLEPEGAGDKVGVIGIEVSVIKNWILTPILIFVVAVLGDARPPLEEPRGFDAAGVSGAPRVLPDAFEL